MKVYSVLIASVTLFVFYNLAVFQEHIAETRNNSEKHKMTAGSEVESNAFYEEYMRCHVSSKKITDKSDHKGHHVGQDDFALQVFGKDHLYLYTGVSFVNEDNIGISPFQVSAARTTTVKPGFLVSTDDLSLVSNSNSLNQ